MKLRTAKTPTRPQIVPTQKKPVRKGPGLLRRLMPLSIFLAFVAGIGALAYWYHFMPRAIGRVYAEEYIISSKRRALIETLHVKYGDTVQKGQVLVTLDLNELKAAEAKARDALKVAEEEIAARRGELWLRQEELRLRLDDNLILRAVEMESARSALSEDMSRLESGIELAKGAEIEVVRNEQLVKTKAVAQARLDDALTRYNSLSKQVENYKKVVAADTDRYQTAIKRYQSYKEKDINVPIDEMMRPVIAAVAVAKAEIEQVRAEIDNSILKAPVNGTIARVHRRTGVGTDAADPILTLIGPNRTLVEAFVQEKWAKSAKVGATVTLRPFMAPFDKLQAKIVSVGPNVTAVPRDYLSAYDQTLRQGVRFIVRLPDEWKGLLWAGFDVTF